MIGQSNYFGFGFPSRFINRLALGGGFARPQLAELTSWGIDDNKTLHGATSKDNL